MIPLFVPKALVLNNYAGEEKVLHMVSAHVPEIWIAPGMNVEEQT